MGASRGRVICHVLVEAHQDGAHADDDGDAHLYRVRSRSVWNDLRAIARQTVAEFEDCSVDDEDDGLEHNVYATVMLHGVEKHSVRIYGSANSFDIERSSHFAMRFEDTDNADTEVHLQLFAALYRSGVLPLTFRNWYRGYVYAARRWCRKVGNRLHWHYAQWRYMQQDGVATKRCRLSNRLFPYREWWLARWRYYTGGYWRWLPLRFVRRRPGSRTYRYAHDMLQRVLRQSCRNKPHWREWTWRTHPSSYRGEHRSEECVQLTGYRHRGSPLGNQSVHITYRWRPIKPRWAAVEPHVIQLVNDGWRLELASLRFYRETGTH